MEEAIKSVLELVLNNREELIRVVEIMVRAAIHSGIYPGFSMQRKGKMQYNMYYELLKSGFQYAKRNHGLVTMVRNTGEI